MRRWWRCRKEGVLHFGAAVLGASSAADGWRKWSRVMSGGAGLNCDKEKNLKIFVVAGEPSGDVIGGRLMAAFKKVAPKPVEFAGVGGAAMEKEGLKPEFNMDELAVMGILELVPHTFRIWRRLRQTIKAATEFQPNVVVTIDSKGFSFRLLQGIRGVEKISGLSLDVAEQPQAGVSQAVGLEMCGFDKKMICVTVSFYADACTKAGTKPPFTVHYVAPSFWAWKGGEKNLGDLATFVDHLLCILPFEREVCVANGVDATFVGHPVLEDAFEHNTATDLDPSPSKWLIRGDATQFRLAHRLPEDATLISVLPGSRLQEVKLMLPIFGGALQLLKRTLPNIMAVIPTVPSEYLTRAVTDAVEDWDIPAIVLPRASQQEKYNAFAASEAGLCTSGTAVMQMQLARLPTVVAYRSNIITEQVMLSRTKLQYISLPNIMLNSAVLPEALFSSCSPENLETLLRQALSCVGFREMQKEAAERVLPMLVPTEKSNWARPSMVAAKTILEAMRLRDGLESVNPVDSDFLDVIKNV